MMKYQLITSFLLITIFHLTYQTMFTCDVEGQGTRLLHLRNENNVTSISAIKNASLNSNLKTYIVIHGWIENPRTPLNLKLAKTLAKYEPNNNILLLDYSKWSRKFYSCAKEIVMNVAEELSEFIINEVNNTNISLDKLHLIGFSLGAHIAGLTGRIVESNFNQRIHRITGLDPAGPLFTEPSKEFPELALNKKDATIVDVLHTTSLIGTWEALGTVDFYAIGPYDNVGFMVSVQPACVDNLNMGCSHTIARKYYIESITSCGIKGVDTNDDNRIATFGHHMPEDIEGSFEFEPDYKVPYGTYSQNCDTTSL